MNALKRSVIKKFARIARNLATESERPFAPPPPAPESRRAVIVRNTIIITGISVISWVFLKPWDGESILDHLDSPKPSADVKKNDGDKSLT